MNERANKRMNKKESLELEPFCHLTIDGVQRTGCQGQVHKIRHHDIFKRIFSISCDPRGFWTPRTSFPTEPAIPQIQPKMCAVSFQEQFFAIFWASRTWLDFCLEKCLKNRPILLFLASKIQLKSIKKSIQNLQNFWIVFNKISENRKRWNLPKSQFLTIFEKMLLLFLKHALAPKNLEKTYEKPLPNKAETKTKSSFEIICFSTSSFSCFGPHFGGSWLSKSTALLAAPGVLDPTAFHACISILSVLHFSAVGEAKAFQNRGQNRPT